MKAVVMAGGKGTRLRPLSCDLPKPMVPILNRPMLEHILELLKKHGITDVIITICYLPEQIMAYFGDGSEWGMRITYFIEETPLGTAGSVHNAAELLDETFLVISGDALTDFDLTTAIRYHREKKALATQILTRVAVPLEYGVVITDVNGRIRQFLEKPSWSEVFSDTVNTGIYVLEPRIFSFYEAGKEVDFSKDLFPYLLKKGEPLFGYIADGYWSDIGNLEQYRLSHFDLLDGKVGIRFDGRRLADDIWIGSGTIIEPGATLKGPCYIGRNCYISSTAAIGEYTIIGDNCTIQAQAGVKRSVLWRNVYVGRGCEVKGAILADRVVLKQDCQILEGAVVGKGSTIGRGVLIKPNVQIWPDKRLTDRLVLTSSLVWGSCSPQHLFGDSGVSGTANVEITPEFAAKLGAAFGCLFAPRSKVAVATDGGKAARVLKRAAISGLLSSGVSVADLGSVTAPVLRQTITARGLSGGLFLRLAGADQLSIDFYDQSGLPLAKGVRRNLENLFFREDFARPAPEKMGELYYLAGLNERYLETLFVWSAERWPGSHLRVFIGYTGKALSELVQLLAQQAPTVFVGRELADSRELGRETLAARADLGLWIEPTGVAFKLVDETGLLWREEMVWNLLVYGMFLRGRRQVTVPITAPGSVEKIAAKFGATVQRCKADQRSVLLSEPPPLGLPAYDGLAALALVVEVMLRTGLPLSALREDFPVPVRKTTNVHCAWEYKGKVMRSLLETAGQQRVQLLDGVKVFHQHGWALVWPDAEEPLFHILSEAETLEEADALTKMYLAKISQIIS